MIVRDANHADIARIVHAMRADDAHEVYACRFTRKPEDLVADITLRRPYMLGLLALCADDGRAIGLLGATLIAPHMADVLMIATNEWPEIARAATKYSIRSAIPAYLDANAIVRAECRCWIGNAASRAWLGVLGFACEARLRCFGGKGEDFLLYVRLNPDLCGGAG